MSLGQLNLAVQFYGCSFASNRASQGGALMVDFANGLSTTSTTVDIRLVNCTVAKNNAQTDGGGVYAGSHNVLTLSGVQLTRNVAGGRGGGMYVSIYNRPVVVTQSLISGNTAGSAGGGLYVDYDVNAVAVDRTTFQGNVAASVGGAVAVETGNALTVSTSTMFMSNRAHRNGGAIAVTGSALTVGPGRVAVTNNTAGGSGSGLYLVSSSTSAVALATATTALTFANNVCKTQGGTVFWVFDGSQVARYNTTPFRASPPLFTTLASRPSCTHPFLTFLFPPAPRRPTKT